MNIGNNRRVKYFITAFSVSVAIYLGLILYDSLYSDSVKIDSLTADDIYVIPLSDKILEYHRRLNLTNPGYHGAGVKLPKDLPEEIQVEVDKGQKEFKFNEFISRIIPMDRELPDYRQEQCKSAFYSNDLPKASIILSFYNEPFTMLMRTIYSILKRTPLDLIEEILLIDDCSDKESLLKPLLEIIPRLPKIRMIRSSSRLGLMQARVLGAKNAKAPVLVIMDSHVEVSIGWLPPLLDLIKRERKTITLPTLETLSSETLEYVHGVWGQYPWVGGFNWKMMYLWFELPKPLRDDTPLASPTMLGAAFAIRKDFFEHLGYYDTGFELWGGENMELCFKVWMCGGAMYHTYCSHVGHILRERPYWNDEADRKKMRNTDRLAEVWLDEYKEFYYKERKFEVLDFGDISEQKKLRERLGCKPFKWYVDLICQLAKPNETSIYGLLSLCK